MTVVVAARKRIKFDPKTFLSTIDGGRKIADFPKKQPIFVQGDPSDAVFYIQKGRVKPDRCVNDREGSHHRHFERGRFFRRRLGQVSRPTLKSDAENVVKRIEGVEHVDNQIKVLPTSPNDDRIRRAVYRAIYGNEVLSQYALRAVPPIHIIVENGNVTLEGVVARQMDKQIAEMQAKSVPGVFSVTNNLRIEEEGK